MKLIGINGKKGSGKSTFAEEIKTFYMNEFQRTVIRAAFAQPLKQICYELFGGHLDNYYGNDEKKNMPTPYWKEKLGYSLDKDNKRIHNDNFDTYRKIMQTIGTELFRDCLHKDFWLMVMEQRYNIAKTGFNAIYVIDDVRFDNEAEWILRHDGVIYSLETPPHRVSAEADAHVSESGLSKNISTKKLCFNDMLQMKNYVREVLRPFIAKELGDCK